MSTMNNITKYAYCNHVARMEFVEECTKCVIISNVCCRRKPVNYYLCAGSSIGGDSSIGSGSVAFISDQFVVPLYNHDIVKLNQLRCVRRESDCVYGWMWVSEWVYFVSVCFKFIDSLKSMYKFIHSHTRAHFNVFCSRFEFPVLN